MRSESTSALGQPSDTKLTRGVGFSLISEGSYAVGRRWPRAGFTWVRFVAYSGQEKQMQCKYRVNFERFADHL